MEQFDPQHAFAAAIQHHQAGRITEAEALYRNVLRSIPNHPDSLHFLGVIAGQRGQYKEAVDLIGRAIAANKRQPNAEFHANIALAFRALGQPDAALDHYKQALAIDPSDASIPYRIANILSDLGRLDEAVGHYGRALARKPDFAEAHNNLGLVLQAQGKSDEAINHYRRALAVRPGYAAAHNNLAIALKGLGELDEATLHYRRALALAPGNADAHYNLGIVLMDQDKLDEAAAQYERALALDPKHVGAHLNLGNVRKDQGRPEEAAAYYERAAVLKTDNVEAHNNLGIVLMEQGRLDAAMGRFRQVTKIAPDHADAHANAAVLRLLRGEFAAGWEEYEWRWHRKESPPRPFDRPLWDGGDLSGRTILLHAEQGYGDTFQFIRYAQLVKRRGARVVVECQPGLTRLLTATSGIDDLFTRGETLPLFDCHAPLLSLPRLFGTVLETIPAAMPYIHPARELVAAWRGRIGSGPGLNVGLAWRGNRRTANEGKRSIAAGQIAALCAIPGINWIGIQKDATSEEIGELSRHLEFRNYGPLLSDWAETAALMSVLDLVVTIDTGVAHLAGALGRPTWVLLKSVPHWGWLLEREDSPWYPATRLFRQTAPDDWTPVISRMGKELAKLA